MTSIPNSSFSSRNQTNFRSFAGFDLAAGKLPKPGHRLARRPLRNEHAAVGVDKGTSGDQNDFGAYHRLTLKGVVNGRLALMRSFDFRRSG